MKLMDSLGDAIWQLFVLPFKMLYAATGLAFRAGYAAGTAPVKGSAFAVRKLGLKATLLFAAGIALGVVIGRRLGSSGVELTEASYPGDFGSSVDRVAATPTAVAEVVTAAEEEAEAELEAAIDSALGVTGGELGVDTADVDEAG